MTAAYDFRGKSSDKAIESVRAISIADTGAFSVLLDNPMVASKVRTSLEENGYDVSIEDDEGTVVLKAYPPAPGAPSVKPSRKTASVNRQKKTMTPQTAPRQAHPVFGGCTVLLSGRTIGGSDEEHGEHLAMSFLESLNHTTPIPQTIILMNEGVKLAVKGTRTCDDITALNRRGCRVLLSRDCVTHFGIEEVLGVGNIVSFQDITTTLVRSERTLSF